MSSPEPVLRAATWSDREHEIRAIRQAVFVVEQAVPEELDFDGTDPPCAHALAFLGDTAVATGRMMPDGHIGRIAVLRAHRGRGIGSALVRHFIDLARRRGLDRVYLDAQVAAIRFYEKLGFRKTGGVFLDAGIEHIRMERGPETPR